MTGAAVEAAMSGDAGYDGPMPDRSLDPYAYAAAHRRLAWLLRLSVMLNVVLGASQALLVSAIFGLLPLKETQIALIRSHDLEDRTFQVLPVEAEVEGVRQLLEQKARMFVRQAFAVDSVTQRERYRDAMRLGRGDVRLKLEDILMDSGLVDDLLADGVVREIRVLSSDRIRSLEQGRWKFVVDYDQVDIRPDGGTNTRAARAYVTLGLFAAEIRPEERFDNPLGVRVTEFAVVAREAVGTGTPPPPGNRDGEGG